MKVSIIGASGYAGAELLRILVKHPEVDLVYATSRQYESRPIKELYPNLNSFIDLKFSNESPKTIAQKSDFVFTSTPHTAAMKLILELVESDIKIVDLSGDFRFLDYKNYEYWYHTKHIAKELNEKFVYGLPELYRKEIKKANYVSNPGCFPTGAILALYPILESKNIDFSKVIVDSKTGSSGAGASPKKFTIHSQCEGRVKPYKPISHRHTGEMEQELSRVSKKSINVAFTPHLVPVTRGIESSCYIYYNEEDDFESYYKKAYGGEYFVRFLGEDIPDLKSVVGSNFVDVGLAKDERINRLTIFSAIDNLIKGASGQAVQNFNLMCNFDEKQAIDQIALNP